MSDPTDPVIVITPPPVGSIPFYDNAVRLGKTWAQLWLDQGSIWNEQWRKLKDNSYEAKDWYSAIMRSTELTSAALGDVFLQLTGDPTPPWVSLEWGEAGEPEVKLRLSLSANDVVSVSRLSLLGQSDPKAIPPVVRATGVKGNPRAVKLWFEKKQDAAVPDGQYIGFVMRSSSPEPIAIVTVNKGSASVPEAARVAVRRTSKARRQAPAVEPSKPNQKKTGRAKKTKKTAAKK